MVNLAEQTAVSNTAAGWWMKKVIYQNSSKEGYEKVWLKGSARHMVKPINMGHFKRVLLQKMSN